MNEKTPLTPEIMQSPLPAPVAYHAPQPQPESIGVFLVKQFTTILAKTCYFLAKPLKDRATADIFSQGFENSLPELENSVAQLEQLTDFPNPRLIAFCRAQLSRLRRLEAQINGVLASKSRTFFQFGSTDTGHHILTLMKEGNALSDVLELVHGIGYIAKSIPHQLRHQIPPTANISDATILSSRDWNALLSRGRRLTLVQSTLEEIELHGNLSNFTFIQSVLQGVSIELSGDHSDRQQILDDLESWQTAVTELPLPNISDDAHPWPEGMALLGKGAALFNAWESLHMISSANGLTFRDSNLKNITVNSTSGQTFHSWTFGRTGAEGIKLNGHFSNFRFIDCRGDHALIGITALGALIENSVFTRTHLQNANLTDTIFRGCTFDGVDWTNGRFLNVHFEHCRITNVRLDSIIFDGTLTISGHHSKFTISNMMVSNEFHLVGIANGLTISHARNMFPRCIWNELEILRLTLHDCEPTDSIPNYEELVRAKRLVITGESEVQSNPRTQEAEFEVLDISGCTVLKITTDPHQGILQAARATFQASYSLLGEWREQLLDRQHDPHAVAELLHQIGSLPILWSDIQTLVNRMQTFSQWDCPQFTAACQNAIEGSRSLIDSIDRMTSWCTHQRYLSFEKQKLQSILSEMYQADCQKNETALCGDPIFEEIIHQAEREPMEIMSLLEEQAPHRLPVRMTWLKKQVPLDPNPIMDLEQIPFIVEEIWTRDRRGLSQVIDETHGYFASLVVITFPHNLIYTEITGSNLREYAADLLREAGDQAYSKYFAQAHIRAAQDANAFRRNELAWGYLAANMGIRLEDNLYQTVLTFAKKRDEWVRIHRTRQRDYYDRYQHDQATELTLEIEALLRRYHGNTKPTFEEFCHSWDVNFEAFSALDLMLAA